MCVVFRYTRSFTVPSSFRNINVSTKRRELSLSSSYVNLMLPVVSMFLRCSVSSYSHPFLTTFITSSTYLFHCFGLHVIGTVGIAFCSSHSMEKFVITGDTGLHIDVPNFC